MELDSIKKIVQTEKQAEEIKANARKNAEETIQNAIESKTQKELFAKRRIEDKKQLLEQKAKEENLEAIRKISENTKQECEQIERKASEKLQIAVDAIFKEVIS